MSPYRGVMPKPRPMALVVAGHYVRADSLDEFADKLQALGAALDFTVQSKTGGYTLTFAKGESVTVEGADPSCLPN